LLEKLPLHHTSDWQDVCHRFLSLPKHGLTTNEKRDIQDRVMSLLQDSKLALLFSDNSMAEVPILGKVGSYFVAGHIDRLVIEERRLLIVDYKFTQQSPLDDVPKAYLHQMASYKAVLQSIYPNHEIESYLLWIEDLHMMLLSKDILDAFIETNFYTKPT
jgi:ATP-dependent helicase/nuclease subunit A